MLLSDYYLDNLTDSQEKAVEALDSFLVSDDSQAFILQGYAGTGKTYLLKGLIDYLNDIDIPFLLMAPTGRAARVITEKSTHRAYTIHKSIYKFDPESAEKLKSGDNNFKYLYDLKDTPFEGGVIIIDEASMISDNYSESKIFRFGSGKVLQDLLDFTNLDFNKIIFIGDPAQLPPVKSEFSPALSSEYLNENYKVVSEALELNEVVRQENESGILQNANRIRHLLQYEWSSLELQYNDSDFVEIAQEEFLDYYNSVMDSDEEENCVVLAYSNKQTNHYNKHIRKEMYGAEKQIQSGEKIMIVHNNYNYDIELMNGEIGYLIDADDTIETKSIKVGYGKKKREIEISFRDALLRFKDNLGIENDIQCKIIEGLLDSPERDISEDEALALYVEFSGRNPEFDFKNLAQLSVIRKDPYLNALHIKYGYAMTCHKSQGGEWDYVFIHNNLNTRRIHKNNLRWLYTAITRAKKTCFIVNPKKKPTPRPKKIEKVEIHFDDEHEEITQRINNRVLAITNSENIRIKEIKHLPICERYYLEIEEMTVWTNFWYTNGKITLNDFQPNAPEEIVSKLKNIFKDLKL